MGVAFNPYDFYEVGSDPYPVYARLREEAPVHRNDDMDFWALSRHADVVAAFRDPSRFSSANGPLLERRAWGPQAQQAMSFIAMDPPRHTRMRRLVSRVFTPRRIAELEEHIRAAARHHVEAAVERGEFDLVADIAAPLPTDVISELVGVPHENRTELRRLADLSLHREPGTQEITREGADALLRMVGHFAEIVAERHRRRRDDLASALLDAAADEEPLTDAEIIAFLHLLVGAGNETTTNLIGNAWYWAWRNPAQRDKALQGRVSDWVEETLRYDTPAPTQLRTLTEDVELHGVRLAEGARIVLLPGAANRDPRVFDRPDEFDLDRDTSQKVSFGSGPHFCLGSSLARLETRIVLEETLARIRGFDLDPTRARRPHSAYIRGFSALPMSVTPR
ncbi:cytochrome P450 [Actinomadura algeriensis]|uniref:Cytochrome P450 n=1 Tax=Actinomadura algeriensis TaxID=1679523 RepID=A0ABR9JTZ7_9ACTN|nr:cytochrome P450 [Actinomadura algeriensis]MBE1533983.1 cytochrome P450 [Actinomadura algeriensis]